eukprot:11598532-Alexandrium_andersonii.AAC.1
MAPRRSAQLGKAAQEKLAQGGSRKMKSSRPSCNIQQSHSSKRGRCKSKCGLRGKSTTGPTSQARAEPAADTRPLPPQISM